MCARPEPSFALSVDVEDYFQVQAFAPRIALEVLRDCGYAYDSSIYPIRRRRYGYPEGPLRPTRLAAGARDIAEFPLPTVPLGPLRFPVLAGAYLRLLPAWVSMAAAGYHER